MTAIVARLPSPETGRSTFYMAWPWKGKGDGGEDSSNAVCKVTILNESMNFGERRVSHRIFPLFNVFVRRCRKDSGVQDTRSLFMRVSVILSDAGLSRTSQPTVAQEGEEGGRILTDIVLSDISDMTNEFSIEPDFRIHYAMEKSNRKFCYQIDQLTHSVYLFTKKHAKKTQYQLVYTEEIVGNPCTFPTRKLSCRLLHSSALRNRPLKCAVRQLQLEVCDKTHDGIIHGHFWKSHRTFSALKDLTVRIKMV
ncbi:hypothetical protein G5I_00729 [Acromyrmex echinatior]|uniref:Uncharacterized protein n=1 Tax=Acromyrmex echinatior TaxID=103372 RepID=F4W5N1_ACREC|nr:hypothetical protein G5I_00729 [Acromyrmex echinatior]